MTILVDLVLTAVVLLGAMAVLTAGMTATSPQDDNSGPVQPV